MAILRRAQDNEPIRVTVPPMLSPLAPSPVLRGQAGVGADLAPSAPQTFSPLTHSIGIPDVSDQTLMQYMRVKQEPNEALMHARLDRIWLQVAKEYRILTGDKKHDHMLWEDHQLFMQGAVEQDPIMHDDNARDEFLKRVMEIMGGE